MSVNVYENGELKNISGGSLIKNPEIINGILDVSGGETIPDWSTPDADRLQIAHITLPEIGIYMIAINFAGHLASTGDIVLRSPFPLYSYNNAGLTLNGVFIFSNDTPNNTLNFKVTGGATNTLMDVASKLQAVRLI